MTWMTCCFQSFIIGKGGGDFLPEEGGEKSPEKFEGADPKMSAASDFSTSSPNESFGPWVGFQGIPTSVLGKMFVPYSQ